MVGAPCEGGGRSGVRTDVASDRRPADRRADRPAAHGRSRCMRDHGRPDLADAAGLVHRREPACARYRPHGEPESRTWQQRCVVPWLCLAQHGAGAAIGRLRGGIPLRQAGPGPGGPARAGPVQGPRLSGRGRPRSAMDASHPRRAQPGAARLRPVHQAGRPHLCGVHQQQPHYAPAGRRRAAGRHGARSRRCDRLRARSGVWSCR
ncbi:hypothetical protein D3C72_1391220 [compost metagenome]